MILVSYFIGRFLAQRSYDAAVDQDYIETCFAIHALYGKRLVTS